MGRLHYFFEFVMTWVAVVLWPPLALPLIGLSVGSCSRVDWEGRIVLGLMTMVVSAILIFCVVRTGLWFPAYVQRREKEWLETADARGRVILPGAGQPGLTGTALLSWRKGTFGAVLALPIILMNLYLPLLPPWKWLGLFGPCGVP